MRWIKFQPSLIGISGAISWLHFIGDGTRPVGGKVRLKGRADHL